MLSNIPESMLSYEDESPSGALWSPIGGAGPAPSAGSARQGAGSADEVSDAEVEEILAEAKRTRLSEDGVYKGLAAPKKAKAPDLTSSDMTSMFSGLFDW